MLSISTMQMAALREQLQRNANEELVRYARKRFPEYLSARTHQELLQLVQRIREVSNSYKVFREDNVATFVDFAVMYGEHFDCDPWAASTLANMALSGPERVTILKYKVQRTGVAL